MSDDLSNEIAKAIGDLEEQAPPPPSLEDIRAGGPVPLAARPTQPWRRPAVLVAAAAAVTVIVVGVAAVIASGMGGSTAPAAPNTTEPAGPDITASAGPDTTASAGPDITPPLERREPFDLVYEDGDLPYSAWLVTSFTFEGETVTVDPDALRVNGIRPPYVAFTFESVEGWTGCNTFGSQGPPTLDGDWLTFGEVFATLAGCLDDKGIVEPALLAALWSEGVELFMDRKTMTWTNDAVLITFAKTNRFPRALTPQWETSVGRLDCVSNAVMSFDLPGRDLDPAIIFEVFPDVVTVEGDAVLGADDPFAWGLDEAGAVVAGTAPHDIEPPKYEVYACATTFGMRPLADLTGAATTWINDLGLDQIDTMTWNRRFIDLCSAPGDDLQSLAAQYVEEDAELSLAPDGALPTTEQATQTLEVIRSMVCPS
ncbi:MAG: META domain-containing protein [Acidimicrobiia bacterium]|nr:META domain-containing protein [Acidimicrobiia bacterium]